MSERSERGLEEGAAADGGAGTARRAGAGWSNRGAKAAPGTFVIFLRNQVPAFGNGCMADLQCFAK